MPLRIPLGIDDFRKLRELGLEYVDKSDLIRGSTNVLSYHDLGGVVSERVYHGFVLGLLAVLESTHEVRSNQDSGGGRPAVLIRPRQPGSPES